MSRRSGNSTPISLFSFQDIITSVTGIMILVTLMMAVELVQRHQASPPHQSQEIIKQVKPIVSESEDEIKDLEEKLARGEEVLRKVARIDASEVRRKLDDLKGAAARIERDLLSANSEKLKARKRAGDVEAEQERRKGDSSTIEDLINEAREIEKKLQELRDSNRIIYNVVPNLAKTPWLAEIADDRVVVALAGQPSTPQVFTGSDADQSQAFLEWAARRNPDTEFFMLLIKPSGIDSFRQVVDQLRRSGFDVGFDLLSADQTVVDAKTGAAAP